MSGKNNQDAQPNPWERQDGESSQAYQAFLIYRDLGPGRTFAAVAEKSKKCDSLIRKWKRRWNWRERADAWDVEMDRQTCEELRKGIAKMRKEHTGIAKAMLVKSLKALQRIPEDELTPRDITTMVDVASKLERISRGEATERTEGRQTVAGEVSLSSIDLSKVSDDELETLDAITGKIFTK